MKKKPSGILRELRDKSVSEFGKRVKELRKQLYLDQTQLAEKLGLNNQTISNWENQGTEPRYNIIKSIIMTFPEIDARWFITGEGEPFGNAADKKILEIKNQLLAVYQENDKLRRENEELRSSTPH